MCVCVRVRACALILQHFFSGFLYHLQTGVFSGVFCQCQCYSLPVLFSANCIWQCFTCVILGQCYSLPVLFSAGFLIAFVLTLAVTSILPDMEKLQITWLLLSVACCVTLECVACLMLSHVAQRPFVRRWASRSFNVRSLLAIPSVLLSVSSSHDQSRIRTSNIAHNRFMLFIDTKKLVNH